MPLDADKIRRFREDGFLVFDTGLSSEAVSDLRKTLARLHHDNVGFKEGALYDALGVDDAASGRQRARDGVTHVEATNALKRMDSRIAAWEAVGKHGSLMCPGKINHAAIGLIHRLQGEPEADFVRRSQTRDPETPHPDARVLRRQSKLASSARYRI